MKKLAALFLLIIGTVSAYTGSSPTFTTNGTQTDVAAAITAAIDGDTIVIPSGTFNWSSGVTINAAGIHLRGAGGGRVEGSSSSSFSISTGSKTFVIDEGTWVSSGWTAGETVRANLKCRGSDYLEGTVTSWDSSTRQLVLNITTTGGSGGPYTWWTFEMPALTTIIHNFNGILIDLTPDANAPVELSAMRLKQGSAVPVDTNVALLRVEKAAGREVLIHDLRTTNKPGGSGWTDGGGCRHISLHKPTGVIMYRVYMDTGFEWGVIGSSGCPGYGIAVKDAASGSSWDAVSTMGANDTTGLNNCYVENCYFQGLWTEAMDWDDNSKGVVRYCVFDNSGVTSHGNDTSQIGVRHVEYYNNRFMLDDIGTNTANMNYGIWFRGGTGLMTDNVMPDLTSTQWGNTPEIRIDCILLQRNTGWAYGVSGVQYPFPRQFGFGYVTGTGVDGWIGASTFNSVYVGDAEPFYQWNNTGGGAGSNIAAPYIANDSPGDSNEDDVSGYIQVGREYINGAKPGYTKFTYPHPLRTDVTSSSNPRHTPPKARGLGLSRRR